MDNHDKRSLWRNLEPPGAFLYGAVIGALVGTFIGIALNDTSVYEIFLVGAAGGLAGGMSGSTFAFQGSYPRQARMFMKCFSIVFWIVFFAFLFLGFWRDVAVRNGLFAVILLAGMLSAVIMFTMGSVWGLIVAAHHWRKRRDGGPDQRKGEEKVSGKAPGQTKTGHVRYWKNR